MSLKLGNTNIAGTQVLYSTTGNNTDGAMTQNATTTYLNLKANDADVVHKTGDETIGGVKTFAGDGWLTKIQNTDVTYNIAPSSGKGTSIVFTDKNGTQMGCVEIMRYPSNNTFARFNVYGANGNWASQALELMIDTNGNTTAFAPESDVNNSIVTTISKSKAENGYFKLGNGLIINWGRTSNTQQTNVTFSKAYSSASSYAVIAVPYTSSNSSQDGYGCYITNLSSTGCTIWNKMYGSSISAIKHWIAIGY